MAKRKVESKRRSTRARAQQTVWVGAAVPVGIDADVVLWVDRKTGALLADTVVRAREVADALARLFEGIASQRGPGPTWLRVPSRRIAETLRERLEGVSVGHGLDGKDARLIEEAVDRAPCLDQESSLTLSGGEPVYTLKVTLRDTAPPIWRRIRIAGDSALSVLHQILQVAMGWEDCHLHQIEIGGARYGLRDENAPPEVRDEHDTEIQHAFGNHVRATYLYDFGDEWVHDLLVEEVRLAAPGDPIATCVDGARACPPEDSGGPQGYLDHLRALASPADDDDRERREWIGEDFDPEHFDLEHVRSELRDLLLVGGALEDDDWEDDDWEDGDVEGDEDNAIAFALLGEDPSFEVWSEDWQEGEGECLYDAGQEPDASEWLGMAERERMRHVFVFHRQCAALRSSVESPAFHAAIHTVVETQVATGEPAEVGRTLQRLQREGLDRHEAVHAIGSVLIGGLEAAVRGGFDESALVGALEDLSAATWRRQRLDG